MNLLLHFTHTFLFVCFFILLSVTATSPNRYSTFLRLSSYCESTLKESEPQFSKLVIVLIDALRVDFLPTVAHSLENRPKHDRQKREKIPPPVPRMPWLEEKVITSGNTHPKSLFTSFDL